MAPTYVLTASEQEEELKKAKKAMDEKEHELQDANAKIAKLEAMQDPHPPVTRDLKSAIKAIMKAMDDDEHKDMKGMDEEHKEKAKKAIKAIEEVFEEGNGTQVSNPTEYETSANTQGEPATKVIEAAVAKRVGPLENKIKKPIIAKILTAKVLKGATEDQIKVDTERLEKMSLTAVEAEFESNKVFIEEALTGNTEETGTQALIAKEEKEFSFNGVQPTGLTANTVSIDAALEKVTV